MASPRLSLKCSLLLSAFFATSLFSSAAFAQNNGGTTITGATTAATTGRSSSSSRSTSTPTTSQSSTSVNTRSQSSSSTATLPALTSGTTGSPLPTLTGLPTLSKTVNTEIPDYPAPTIPPTQNAPFMNHSTLPDGTVFIAVGAILGLFGAIVLVWRGILACLLHRSVERATLAQHMANDKNSTYPKYLERENSPPRYGAAAAVAAVTNRATKKSHRPIPPATASQTNLFFSPTANPVGGGAGGVSRDSRFLPSGFYASSSVAPIAGHMQGSSISMSMLRPSSRGGGSAVVRGQSPPDPESPDVGPRRNFSTSTLNLNRAPSGRAPSAFLDDLLDDGQGGQGAQFLPGSGAGGQYYRESPSPPHQRY